MDLCEKLHIDEIDIQIIKLLQKNPNIPQSRIAKEVRRSQPAVRTRVGKLKEQKLICEQIGVNMLNTNLNLAYVRFSAKVPRQVLAVLSSCSHILQVFKTTGSTNFLAIIGGQTLKDIEEIVNKFLRGNDNVTDIDLNFISDSLYSAIFPYDIKMNSQSKKQTFNNPVEEQTPVQLISQ